MLNKKIFITALIIILYGCSSKPKNYTLSCDSNLPYFNINTAPHFFNTGGYFYTGFEKNVFITFDNQLSDGDFENINPNLNSDDKNKINKTIKQSQQQFSSNFVDIYLTNIKTSAGTLPIIKINKNSEYENFKNSFSDSYTIRGLFYYFILFHELFHLKYEETEDWGIAANEYIADYNSIIITSLLHNLSYDEFIYFYKHTYEFRKNKKDNKEHYHKKLWENTKVLSKKEYYGLQNIYKYNSEVFSQKKCISNKNYISIENEVYKITIKEIKKQVLI